MKMGLSLRREAKRGDDMTTVWTGVVRDDPGGYACVMKEMAAG